jgi:hypothetical protein
MGDQEDHVNIPDFQDATENEQEIMGFLASAMGDAYERDAKKPPFMSGNSCFQRPQPSQLRHTATFYFHTRWGKMSLALMFGDSYYTALTRDSATGGWGR